MLKAILGEVSENRIAVDKMFIVLGKHVSLLKSAARNMNIEILLLRFQMEMRNTTLDTGRK